MEARRIKNIVFQVVSVLLSMFLQLRDF